MKTTTPSVTMKSLFRWENHLHTTVIHLYIYEHLEQACNEHDFVLHGTCQSRVHLSRLSDGTKAFRGFRVMQMKKVPVVTQTREGVSNRCCLLSVSCF